MANPFDQFDVAPSAGAANPFDQFDTTPKAAPDAAAPKTTFESDAYSGASGDDAEARVAREGVNLDPKAIAQNILEFGKGIPEGAMGMVGTGLKGLAPMVTDTNLQGGSMGDVGLTLPEAVPKQNVSAPTAIKNNPLFKAGRTLQDKADIFPAAPGYEESVGRQLGEGVGSVVAGVGASALGGPGTAGVLFTASGAGEAVDRAIAAGATEDQIIQASAGGIIPGLTDSVPIETLMGRIPVPGAKLAARLLPTGMIGAAIKAAGEVGWQAVIEGVQEGGQQWLQNLVAKQVYKPDQDLGEGIVPNAAGGSAVGAVSEIGKLILKSASRRGGHAAQPQIKPDDIHPGDEESPLDTSIIAAGRAKVREALEASRQVTDFTPILTRNGWPMAGSRVTMDDGEGPATTGIVHGAFEDTHPELGVPADSLQVRLDSGHMFTAFKHEIEAAGISITPEQAQQAGLPLDLATVTQPQAPAAAVAQTAVPVAENQTPVETPGESVSTPSPRGMPVDLFQAARQAPTDQVVEPNKVIETTGDGTRAAPIEVTHSDHVEQASELVNTAPTEAQAEAGNYKKLHLKVQGLPITIENPKGSVRRGVDADGKPWEVALPASYGYIKRSTAADGEQVDVYVGPNPQSSKVFVIDQKDAKTGAYDEAKSFIGFDTKEQALETYHAAFSDGLGPQRMGGMREMNTLQFKKLLNSGVLNKPVAGATIAGKQPPAETSAAPIPDTHDKAITKTARAPLAPSRETSVLENIRRMGGIKTVDGLGRPTKEGQDIAAVLKDVNRPGLINNKTGQPADTIRARLKEQGWFGGSPEHGADIQHLYDLIDKEVREGQQFHPESDRARDAAEKAITDDNARVLADVQTEAKKGGGSLTTEEAEQIVVNMGAHGINAEDAVADFIEIKALREQYEDDAQEDAHAAAEAEPVDSGADKADRAHGQGGEEPAPARRDEGGAPEAGRPAPSDSEEAPSLKTDQIPPLRHGDGSWMIVDRATGKVVTEPFKDSKAIHAINFEKYKAVPAGEYLAGPNKKPELAAEPGPAVDGKGKPVDQTIVPGAEKSAQQLAKAKEAAGKGRATTSVEQKDAGGLFAPKLEETEDLFTAPAAEPKLKPAEKQTETAAFKKWFGDSKVVGDDGAPVRVYHGTPHGEFDSFDTYASNYGLMGQGGYFTENPDIASSYANKGAEKMARRGEKHPMRTVYPVFLSIKKPLDMDAVADRDVWQKAFGDNFEMFEPLADGATNEAAYRNVEEGLKDDVSLPLYEGAEIMQGGLMGMGYDGITHVGGGRVGDGPRHRVWIAFEPEQIKSATGNNGSFDSSNADMRFQPSADQKHVFNGTEYKIIAPQTPQFVEKREALARELRAELDKIGLHDVGLKIADAILMTGDGQHMGTAEGIYWRGIITLALDGKIGARANLNHEAIHALRAMGLFSKSEWSMLTHRAQAAWRKAYNVDERWAGRGHTEDLLNEEAIAEAYRDYRAGDETGTIGRIFARVRDFFAAVGRAFGGQGFKTPADIFGPNARDIFGKIDSGEVGARERPFETFAGVEREPSFQPSAENQESFDLAWDATIAASAKKLGWDGEPTSRAMFAKALLTPKGPAKTELYRNAGLIKTMEDQRATPFRPVAPTVKGDGETKVRGTAQSLADKAAKSGVTIEDLPEYDVSTQAPLLAKARKFTAIDTNYEQAVAAAMGLEPPPYGTTSEAMLIAVNERATRDGDHALLLKLGTKSKLLEDLTDAGRRISMMQNLDPTSPVAAIKDVQAAKAKATKKTATPKAKRDAVKDMLDAINAQIKPDREKGKMSSAAKKLKFQMFLNSLTCS